MLLRNVPKFSEAIWGDEKFASMYRTSGRVGEAWLCSNHPEKMTELVDGYGRVREWSEVDRAWNFERFPFLVKHIRSNDWLSVQVHPGDDYAAKLGDPWGKPEMWYFLKGGKVVNGLKRGALEELRKGSRDWDSLLSVTEVGPGQAMYVAPGTVHAIGPGIELYEFQMTSDITYRFHDWGRGRKTHFGEAMAVARENVAVPFEFEGFSSEHFSVRLVAGGLADTKNRAVYLAEESKFNGVAFGVPQAYVALGKGTLEAEGRIFEMEVPN